MPWTVAVVFAAAALAAGLYARHLICSARRALIRERAARRITDAAQARDMAAFHRRINAAIAEQRAQQAEALVLAAADRVVDDELARMTRNNPQEGDTP
ncbi:hypothetical protein [Streptomyces sp. NPDC059783]|uniref:hypothetical protein n=1 Tax=Streptomyces sp. NPDC059783 TaxID=3346944 RepID=UPI003666751F